MGFIRKIILILLGSFLSLWTAAYFISGFHIAENFKSFALAAAIFTLLNVFIRPVIKIIFSPVIFITFGLGIVLVNALIIYLLDYFSQGVIIDDIESLALSTLIISAVNFIIHFISKRFSD